MVDTESGEFTERTLHHAREFYGSPNGPLCLISEVRIIEGSGPGMLLFLQRWTQGRDIRIKLFNPACEVQAGARQPDIAVRLCDPRRNGGFTGPFG